MEVGFRCFLFGVMEKVGKVSVEGNNTLTQPVNVENSKGPIAAESSHLNVGTGPSIELNSIKSKHDFIKLVFDVSLNSTSDIDLFLTELEAGKHPIWSNLDSDTRSKVHEAMSGLLEVYEMNTNATKSNSEDSIKDTMVADSVYRNYDSYQSHCPYFRKVSTE
ncbi:hypothetical protein CTI12_AA111220 [Artemisia annua]|uniref:Uncharacterized protein n=1 Tax=Artemisia annua TaxID=35608 RepID=A0A2U1PUW9_ARTAN|nr:hypothetical protein CTI12_AA111220 [Artemisia annua]